MTQKFKLTDGVKIWLPSSKLLEFFLCFRRHRFHRITSADDFSSLHSSVRHRIISFIFLFSFFFFLNLPSYSPERLKPIIAYLIYNPQMLFSPTRSLPNHNSSTPTHNYNYIIISNVHFHNNSSIHASIPDGYSFYRPHILTLT